ncbi:hypothetical protein FI667_g1606, partial [Globisporangium splendens]
MGTPSDDASARGNQNAESGASAATDGRRKDKRAEQIRLRWAEGADEDGRKRLWMRALEAIDSSTRSGNVGPDSVATMAYENPLPWEQVQGSTIERTIKVSAEAQKIYAQQEQILPALNHDHSIDPMITEHLHDVGRRVLIIRESAKRPSKQEQKILEKNAPKRVIPSRYGEEDGDNNYSDDAAEDPAVLDGRIVCIVFDFDYVW